MSNVVKMRVASSIESKTGCMGRNSNPEPLDQEPSMLLPPPRNNKKNLKQKAHFHFLTLIFEENLTGIAVFWTTASISIYFNISEQRQGIRRSQHAPDVWPAEVGHGAQGEDVLQCQEVQGAQPPGECLLTYINGALFF